MINLIEANLRYLPAEVACPRYARSNVQTGIVHLGLGAFHRAQQATFTDDCLNTGETAWGIAAASLRNPDTRDALAPEDDLYTLALPENADHTLRVIGAINQTFVASEDSGALLATMADPAVRIVSLTVTEKGYTANIAAGGLQSVLAQFAMSRDADCGSYVTDEVACPFCTVDSNVSATTDADHYRVAAHQSMRDARPIVAEP